VDHAYPCLNVLVNLSSSLLCQALAEFLDQHPETCHAVVFRPGESVFEPDTILFDAASLEPFDFAEWPGAKRILMDTGLPEVQIVRLLVTYQLHGVISTGTDLELFQKALQAIHDDQVWVDNQKLKALIKAPPPASPPPGVARFSPREREIVFLIAAGRRNREIAGQLKLSEQTVKSHVSRIFRKASVDSRAQLVPLALVLKNEPR
jgi:LuxR family transcriptional regulator, positive regulator of biofilm formation